MLDPAATRRLPVVVAVMMSMFMVAIEATIVSTAMPQIVSQLGGLTLYSWVFSAFLLTQTAATIIFGKLSDVYGRRPMMVAGIGIFIAGSVACGLATSMLALILFRLAQGVGAGAVQPIAQTIIGDLYDARERGRVQALLASVWASSAVLGPLVGAVIVAHVSWAWIFWINIPFGIAAMIFFTRFLHEGVVRERKRIDVVGAVLFTIAVGALMIALTESSSARTDIVWGAAAIFVVAAILFVWQERRAAEPLVSFALWARRPIAAANGAALLSGMALIGLTTFLPMFVQGVLQKPPIVAGLALTAVMFGWPCGATLAVRIYRRYGLRAILVLGALLLPLGAFAFLTLRPGVSPLVAGLGSYIMGLGMGLFSSASIVMIQEITTWSQRGSATASNVFSRNLGITLGAAAFGAVLNHGLNASKTFGPITSEQLQRVIESTDTSATSEALRGVLQAALHQTFLAMFIVSLMAVAVACLVPYVPMGRAEEQPAE